MAYLDDKSLFPFWEQLTEAQKERLQQLSVKKYFPKGATLHHGEEGCTGLFVVLSGQLRAFIVSESGKEITLYRLLERDICLFSASCIMKNINFTVWITAEKDTEALLIPADLYEKLMKESLAVSEYTNNLMASRFSDVMWVMEQVVFQSFDKRLASFFLELSALEGTSKLYITQEETAQHLGTAREVVTRMLKYFAGEGMVRLFRGGLEITDEAMLRSVAE